MSNVQLKDTCNWFLGEGILKSLTTNFDVPWKSVISDGQTLDDDYYGNHSGNKFISPLAEKLLDTNNKLTSTTTLRLATLLYQKYGDNWNRVWLALQKEYDPIENYNMVENETPAETTETVTPAEIKVTEKPAETKTTITPAETTTTTTLPETTTTTKLPETTKSIKTPETTTTTKVPEQTTTSKPALVKTTTEKDIYGFDSNGASHEGKETVIPQLISGGSGEEKVEQGTKAGEQKIKQGDNAGEEKITQGTNAGEEKIEQGQHAGEESITVDKDEVQKFEQGTNPGEETTEVLSAGSHVFTIQNKRELTRSGNIGVTTTQQMLTQEMEFRRMYNMFDTIVYPHLDKILCLGYYKDTTNGLY